MKSNVKSNGLKKIILRARSVTLLCVAALFGLPAVANALEVSALLTVSSVIDELLFVVALVALFGAQKVYRLVKGGNLAQSWQFFVIGLLCLFLAQLTVMLEITGIFVAPELVRPFLLLVMGGIWLLGIMKARQALG